MNILKFLLKVLALFFKGVLYLVAFGVFVFLCLMWSGLNNGGFGIGILDVTVLMLVYFHFSRTFVSRDYYLKAMAAKRALKENNEL